MNPYYAPEKLNLDMLAFDEPNMCYEYNTLCFWATDDGRVFTAADSGCSCPTPFEEHDRPTVDEVLATMERVGSVEQAVATFDAWNNAIYGAKFGIDDRHRCEEWVSRVLKQDPC